MSPRSFLRLSPLLFFQASIAFSQTPPSAEGASRDVAPSDGAKTDSPSDLSTPAAPPAPAPSADDLAKQLADTQDKLSTALHSYSLLQDENTQLKADAEKAASDKSAVDSQLAEANTSIAALKAQAAVATQVDGLREQVRQSQNQIAALATENADLRTRLALSGSAPSGSTAPLRPGADNLTPVNVPSGNFAKAGPAAAGKNSEAPADLSTAPAPAKPETRTYVVVAGDSLSKIAKKCYGNANLWDKILAANRSVIKNENTVTVGTKLTIP